VELIILFSSMAISSLFHVSEISSEWEHSNILPTFCDATVNNFDQGRALQFPIPIKNLCDLKNMVQLKLFQLQVPYMCA